MSIEAISPQLEAGGDALRFQAQGITIREQMPETSRMPVQTMGQDEFLKLLVAQLVHQDPLSPQSDTEFISQMASFTTLEQTKAMHGDIVKMRAQSEVMEGMSLLDREVVVRTGQGDEDLLSGMVTGMIKEGNVTNVIVGGQAYNLNEIVTVLPKI